MTVGCIIPAAGRGERMGGGQPKALRTLAGATLLEHAVRAMAASRKVTEIVIAAPPDQVTSIVGQAANISEWEKIEVLNITNGSRLETYVILGEKGSGEICINGAAAHLVNPGDLVILVTYKAIEEEKISEHFISSHHDVPTDNINLLAYNGGYEDNIELIHGSKNDFLELIQYISTNDMTKSDVFLSLIHI